MILRKSTIWLKSSRASHVPQTCQLSNSRTWLFAGVKGSKLTTILSVTAMQFILKDVWVFTCIYGRTAYVEIVQFTSGLFLFFQEGISLFNSDCHFVDWTGLELWDPPVSASQSLGLKVRVTTAQPMQFLSQISAELKVHLRVIHSVRKAHSRIQLHLGNKGMP